MEDKFRLVCLDPDRLVDYWICWDVSGELVPGHPETCHLADVEIGKNVTVRFGLMTKLDQHRQE